MTKFEFAKDLTIRCGEIRKATAYNSIWLSISRESFLACFGSDVNCDEDEVEGWFSAEKPNGSDLEKLLFEQCREIRRAYDSCYPDDDGRIGIMMRPEYFTAANNEMFKAHPVQGEKLMLTHSYFNRYFA